MSHGALKHGPQIPTPTRLTATRAAPPPPRPDALMLGVQALRAQDPKTATKILRPLTAEQPLNADALQLLGMALHAQGKAQEAITRMEAALNQNDKAWQWWQNLGVAYQSVGRFADSDLGYGAVTAFEQAVERAPREPDPMHNLGTCYIALGRWDEAERALQKARWMRNDHAMTHFNMGCMYLTLGEVPKAVRWFAQATERDATHNLAHANLIFSRDLLPETTAAVARMERRAWNTRFAAALTRAAPPHVNDRRPDRKLRIGYIGGDFRDHSAMYTFGPLIEAHDPERYEVYIYADAPEQDQYTHRMQAAATGGFRFVQGIDEQHIAGMIRSDRIDVLVETAGFTARHKLLVMARKPAPVQVSGWGYLNGTGLDAIDAFIVNNVLVPEADECYYVERPMRVACPLGFEPPSDDLPILPRDPDAPLTFGNLGRVAKISEACLDLWSDVLKALPESRMLLKDRGYDPERTRDRIWMGFAQRGIDPSRIELRGTSTRAEHMAAYNEVDVVLDALPQSGGVTTLEALWMGVPTVTLYGPRIVGRAAACHLAHFEISARLIAHTREEFIQMALAAMDRRERGPHLREMLRSSIVTDHPRQTRDVEGVYRTLFADWVAKERSA